MSRAVIRVFDRGNLVLTSQARSVTEARRMVQAMRACSPQFTYEIQA